MTKTREELDLQSAQIKRKLRVVKYRRVSTEEQKKKQNSVLKQDENLDRYIAYHDMECVGSFCDEAVSGTKFKRPALLEMFEFIKHNKVDVIIFTKLDRWFRSVKYYYKAQEILDECGVVWACTEEDYNLLTADGIMKVNIMLSVAQNETDRTSSRIKDVFEYKVAHGEAISGEQPLGFTVADKYPDVEKSPKIVVHDPAYEEYMYLLIKNVLELRSVRMGVIATNKATGMTIRYPRLLKALKDTKMYGAYLGYGGNDNYCPPYCTKAQFDEIAEIVKKNTITRRSDRYFIFTTLIKCPVCGRKMVASTHTKANPSGKKYTYKVYRCNYRIFNETETHKHASYSENVIERALLAQFKEQFEHMTLETTVKAKKKEQKTNREEIKKEMDRLNHMFLKKRISVTFYDEEYEKLEAQLAEIPEDELERDYSKIKEMLDGNVLELYKTFSDEEKKIFWRSIIGTFTYYRDEDKIVIDSFV